MAAGDEDWAALGEFVKHRREELELTITGAAKAAGIGRTLWTEIEKGRRRRDGEWVAPHARGEKLAAVARVLGVQLDELRAVLNRG